MARDVGLRLRLLARPMDLRLATYFEKAALGLVGAEVLELPHLRLQV